jgi:hypothetical protein
MTITCAKIWRRWRRIIKWNTSPRYAQTCILTVESGWCVVKMCLCVSKPPLFISQLTPRIKAEVIYNQLFNMSTSQSMLFKIHHLFIIRTNWILKCTNLRFPTIRTNQTFRMRQWHG